MHDQLSSLERVLNRGGGGGGGGLKRAFPVLHTILQYKKKAHRDGSHQESGGNWEQLGRF